MMKNPIFDLENGGSTYTRGRLMDELIRYSGANNTEEGLSPTKRILCVYVYKMYTFCHVFWLRNLLVYLLFFCV